MSTRRRLRPQKKALAGIAARRILLLDHSKWVLSSLCNSVRLEDLDVVITDDKAPAESVDAVARLGIEVIVAKSS